MKNNKGITLITLTVAVLIMIILSSMLIYNAKNGLKIKNLKDMQNDIEILEDKVNAYYVKYADIPAEIEYLGNINFEPQPNDDDEYYVLDLKALEGISLNYGSEFTQIKTREDTYQYNDVYIINKQSFHIYYAKGLEIDGVAYYTNSEDESVTLYRGTYVIGQKGYAETLEKALEKAENGDTIKALKDVEEETSVEIMKNVTIDTNGKNITYKGEQSALISISNGSNVKIIGNGTIESILVSGGTLTITEGKINETIVNSEQTSITNLIIGDNTKSINVENLEIGNIEFKNVPTTDEEFILTINNGIIKELDDNLKTVIQEGTSGSSGWINIREGYKVKKTTDGYILTPKT